MESISLESIRLNTKTVIYPYENTFGYLVIYVVEKAGIFVSSNIT